MTTFDRQRTRSGARWRAAWMALLVVSLAGEIAARNAEVTMASGRVERGRGEPAHWEPIRVGDALAPGEAVRTGPDGRAELSWLGSTLRLYGDSLLRLPSEFEASGTEAGSSVEMESGTGLFDVMRRPGRSFEVRTPEIVVSVKGTRFGVDLSGNDPGVAVYRGTVGVRSLALRALDEVMVREGFRASGGSSELPELFLLREDDPWDAWGPDALAPRISAADTTRGDSSGLPEATRAMVRTYRGEVLRRATQADPALARRLAAVGDARLAVRGEGPAAPDPDDRLESQHLTDSIDPILDGGVDELRNTLQQEFIEAWVNGETTDGGRSGSGTTFEITAIDGSGGSGSDRVRIDEPALALFWEFSESDLDKVIDGSEPLPTDLQTLLQASGIADEQQFATMLLVMLNNP